MEEIVLKPNGGKPIQKKIIIKEDSNGLYQEYLKKMDELDEKSPFYYIWNEDTNSYSKAYYREQYEFEKQKEFHNQNLEWEQYVEKMEKKLRELEEDKKPWIFEYKEDYMPDFNEDEILSFSSNDESIEQGADSDLEQEDQGDYWNYKNKY